MIIIKNPAKDIISEIENWLEKHYYELKYIFVIDSVYIRIYPKMSQEDLDKFKKDIECDISLEGVSYNSNGDKEFKYDCNSIKLNEYGLYVRNWLKKYDFGNFVFIYSTGFKFKTPLKLSDYEINLIENEFKVRCKGYSISCNSNDIDYEFYQ